MTENTVLTERLLAGKTRIFRVQLADEDAKFTPLDKLPTKRELEKSSHIITRAPRCVRVLKTVAKAYIPRKGQVYAVEVALDENGQPTANEWTAVERLTGKALEKAEAEIAKEIADQKAAKAEARASAKTAAKAAEAKEEEAPVGETA